MSAHELASCENCCFNPLQNGSVGLSYGYCVEHRVILRDASSTTCSRHFRKDLPFRTAESFSRRHQEFCPTKDQILDLSSRTPTNDPIKISTELKFLKSDSVGELVSDYGFNDTKIATLSTLRSESVSPRAEFGCLNLSRTYVHRCTLRGGSWTSGLNILWWIKKRLSSLPTYALTDFRYSTTKSLERQQELATWSLLMSRLLVISDIATHSGGALDSLITLPQEAALASENLTIRKLNKWIKDEGLKKINSAMPENHYRDLMREILDK